MLRAQEKIHTHPMEGHRKYLGGGVLKAKIVEAKYEAKLEFLRGEVGVQNKKPSMGGVWIFSGTVQYACACMYPCWLGLR